MTISINIMNLMLYWQIFILHGSYISIIHLYFSYGGPGSQAVNSVFSTGYETYLASTHNVVYAFMDGRGTVGRGEEFKHLLYRKMATIEVEDQLIGTE